ncbi:methionine adenosyltransferase [Patescibacteria group bacterium]|nr:methionine adenosyltransferase [Patescibacteria group bacterium]
MHTLLSRKDFNQDFEIIERKGTGHPDTLADALAEKFSANFSNYCMKKFGVVLHHNFDKLGLLGGSSRVKFGEGRVLNPIRVLINGRASTKFAQETIPIKELLTSWTKEFFIEKLPFVDPDTNLEFHFNLSVQSSPGKTYEKEAVGGARQKWFEPETVDDLPEVKQLTANDTSLGVGYAPMTILEQATLAIEQFLNSPERKIADPWLGSDIKIMACRNKNKFFFTMCIPQIATYVQNYSEYAKNIKAAKAYVEDIMYRFGIADFELSINTRDDEQRGDFYLTATGSSIESGDEGLVGRGNRINGLITPTRPMSMEGSCGKNPIYHIGKIYYVAAFELARRVHEKFGIQNEVYLVSQSDKPLVDPWILAINIPKEFTESESLKTFLQNEVQQIPALSKKIISGVVQLC